MTNAQYLRQVIESAKTGVPLLSDQFELSAEQLAARVRNGELIVFERARVEALAAELEGGDR